MEVTKPIKVGNYWTNLVDTVTGENVNFEETLTWYDGTPMDDSKADGVIYRKLPSSVGGGYVKLVQSGPLNLSLFGVSVKNTKSANKAGWDKFQNLVVPIDSVTLPPGNYFIPPLELSKKATYLFDGVVFNYNNLEDTGNALNLVESTDGVKITGLRVINNGTIYYETSPWHAGTIGNLAMGIAISGKNTTLENVSITAMSHTGITVTETGDTVFIMNCTSSNNGYAGFGAAQGSKNVNITGGVYDENGGGSSNADGYGVYGNVHTSSILKISNVTARKNKTRNIDSHTGNDIIITGCYTEEAGYLSPQWGENFKQASNINITRRANRVIISNNISRLSLGTGIAVTGTIGSSSPIIDNIVVSDNVSDGDSSPIIINPLLTNRIVIHGNTINGSGDGGYSINITTPNPDNDTDNQGFVNNIIISNNNVDKGIRLLINRKPEIISHPEIIVSNNITNRIELRCSTTFTASITDNIVNHYGVQIYGGTLGDTLSEAIIRGNYIDNSNVTATGSDNRPISVSGSSCVVDSNFFKNVYEYFIFSSVEGVTFTNNTVNGINRVGSSSYLIYITGQGGKFSGNTFKNIIAAPSEYAARLAWHSKNSLEAYNNNFVGLSGDLYRVDFPGSGQSSLLSPSVTIDHGRKIYEYGAITPPVGYLTWNVGDVVVSKNKDRSAYTEWLYAQTSTGNQWVPRFTPISSGFGDTTVATGGWDAYTSTVAGGGGDVDGSSGVYTGIHVQRGVPFFEIMGRFVTGNNLRLFARSSDTGGSSGFKRVAIQEYGATANRPSLSAIDAGFIYFDTTLTKPIWWSGSAWVDSTGATV